MRISQLVWLSGWVSTLEPGGCGSTPSQAFSRQENYPWPADIKHHAANGQLLPAEGPLGVCVWGGREEVGGWRELLKFNDTIASTAALKLKGNIIPSFFKCRNWWSHFRDQRNLRTWGARGGGGGVWLSRREGRVKPLWTQRTPNS